MTKAAEFYLREYRKCNVKYASLAVEDSRERQFYGYMKLAMKKGYIEARKEEKR